MISKFNSTRLLSCFSFAVRMRKSARSCYSRAWIPRCSRKVAALAAESGVANLLLIRAAFSAVTQSIQPRYSAHIFWRGRWARASAERKSSSTASPVPKAAVITFLPHSYFPKVSWRTVKVNRGKAGNYSFGYCRLPKPHSDCTRHFLARRRSYIHGFGVVRPFGREGKIKTASIENIRFLHKGI
jgi:hypothetical protein